MLWDISFLTEAESFAFPIFQLRQLFGLVLWHIIGIRKTAATLSTKPQQTNMVHFSSGLLSHVTENHTDFLKRAFIISSKTQ